MTAQLTMDEIMAKLDWSKPRQVPTKRGPRLVSSAKPNNDVFALFEREKDALYKAGYSISQFRGAWQVSRWVELPAEAIAKIEETKALSRATDAAIEIPAPEGLTYLGYQKAGVQWALSRTGSLIGDEMGLGKTIQAIGVINMSPDAKRIVIVCPASLKLNWARELGKWLVVPRPTYVADSKFFPNVDGIVIVNYDVLHKHRQKMLGIEWDIVVCDEAHYLKNPKSRRAKMVFGQRATKEEKKDGMADVPGIVAKKRLLLTGTPIANRPVEIFPLIEYLDPETWGGNFFKFAIRYCNAHRNGFGWDFTGASHLDELQDKLRSTCFPEGVLVSTEYGPKPIGEIVRGNLLCRVWSRDSMGRLSLQPIIGLRETKDICFLVEVRYSSGCFKCTPDHRIFTNRGYVRADRLKAGDSLLALREAFYQATKDNGIKQKEERKVVLLDDLLGERSAASKKGRFRKRAGTKANSTEKDLRGVREDFRGSQRKGLSQSAILLCQMQGKVGLQSLSEIGNSSGKSHEEKGEGPKWTARSQKSVLADTSYSSQPQETTIVVPRQVNECPSITFQRFRRAYDNSGKKHLRRFGNGRAETGHRGGWQGSRDDSSETHRSNPRPRTFEARVLSIKSLELGYRGESNGSRSKGTSVFDIEVAKNHNFFASGILVHNCMVRRLKKDVLTELPPKRRQVIEFAAEGELERFAEAERHAYDEREDEMAGLHAAVEIAKASDVVGEYETAVENLRKGIAAIFGSISTMRRELAEAKTDLCIEHLKGVLEETDKVVVFAHHKTVVARILAAFPGEIVSIVGDTAMADRQAAVDRFQKDPTCKLIIGSFGAMGVGHTLTAAAHVVCCELDWVPGNVSQAEDRCHRIGQKNSVLVQHLVVEGSLDATIAKRIVSKQNVIDDALDEVRAKIEAEPLDLGARKDRGGETVGTPRDQIAKDAETITDDQRKAVHAALKMIASRCNGARDWDGAGFSKIDTRLGKDLAEREWLSPKQAALGRRILRKYAKTQLYPALVEAMGLGGAS